MIGKPDVNEKAKKNHAINNVILGKFLLCNTI